MIVKMVRPLYFPGRVFRKHGFIDCIGRFCVGAIHELPLTDPPESPLLRGTEKIQTYMLVFASLARNYFFLSVKIRTIRVHPRSIHQYSPCLRGFFLSHSTSFFPCQKPLYIVL